MHSGLYKPVFQTGYVTQDIDRAKEQFARTMGIANWYISPAASLPSQNGGSMDVQIAMAFVGPTMVEVIACKGGDDALYRDALPDDRFAVRLHHLGFRLHSDEEWEAMLAEGKRQGLRIAMDVKTASTRALYFDTREVLGHYLEYLYYFDEPNSSIPRVPQNPVE
jgi:hypothetical protein